MTEHNDKSDSDGNKYQRPAEGETPETVVNESVDESVETDEAAASDPEPVSYTHLTLPTKA